MNPLTICYPLKTGAGFGRDMELRYSLRSIEANLRLPIGDLVVVGYKPAWLKDVCVIQAKDDGDKALNLLRKYQIMVDSTAITDPFLLLDDDHTFLREWDQIPLHTKGLLEALAGEYPRSRHGVYLRNCLEILREQKLPELNYQIHFPLVIDKAILRVVLRLADRPTVMGSLYGNLVGRTDVELKQDFKAFNRQRFKELRSGAFISLNDNIVRRPDVMRWLPQTFPVPSRWE